MRTGVQVVVATGVTLVMLTGCSGEQGLNPSEATRSAASAAPTSVGTSSPPVPTPTPIPSGVVEEHGGLVETFTEPAWDQASRAAVLDAAVVALAAFARPDVPYEQWWAEVGPLMSVQAQVDYQYVDPANVPARAVTGVPVLVDEASASVAGVEVPTDVGTYTVTLSRTDAGAGWLVERISPPEALG